MALPFVCLMSSPFSDCGSSMHSGDLDRVEPGEKIYVAAEQIQQVPSLSPDLGNLRYMQAGTEKKVCDLRISARIRDDIKTRPTPSKNSARACMGSPDARHSMPLQLNAASSDEVVGKAAAMHHQHYSERGHSSNPDASQEENRRICSSKPHISAAILRLPPHLLAHDAADSAPPSPGSFQDSPRQLNMSLLSLQSAD